MLITLPTLWTGYKICKEVKCMIDEIPNNIFIENQHSKNIYVAIRAKLGNYWTTKYWYKVPPGQVSLILSEKLQSRSIFCYATTKKGKIVWEGDDYKEVIDGKSREFTKYDTQNLINRLDKGNLVDNRFTIIFSYDKE